MKLRLIITILISGWLIPLSSQNVEQWLNQRKIKESDVSFVFFNLDKGKTITAFQSNQFQAPASTLKVLTTATAWAVLGQKYRYQTPIFLDGELRGSTFHGNLVIVGMGDPSFGTREMNLNQSVLDSICYFLEQQNIQTITGDIIIDVSRFGTDVMGASWAWEDIGNYYGAGAWALNYHDNEYDIFFQQNNKEGSLATINNISPPLKGLQLHNELKTGAVGSGDQAYIFGAPYSNIRHIRGTIPPGNGLFDIQGSIPNPPLFFGETLKSFLASRSIHVQGNVKTEQKNKKEPTQNQTIWHSMPLREIIAVTNKKSNNTYAECLLRKLGEQKFGLGTAENGVKAIKEYWKSKGVNIDDWKIVDGSGLSANNIVKPSDFMEILKIIHRDNSFEGFSKSLAISGEKGTFKYFLHKTALKNNIKGKSGTISNCKNYVGYWTQSNGDEIAFAVFINDYPFKGAKKDVEKLILEMVE